VGMDSQTLPSLPDLAIVAEVIRLAEAAEAERDDQRPAEYPMYRADDLDQFFRPTPGWDALVAYLRGLPEEDVARLYGLYRVGDRPYATHAEAMERYRHSVELATNPMHREHGAYDLAAKGPLADGLRRGLAHLGMAPERHQSRPGDQPNPVTYLED
jgi:hypothetical protein